MSGSSRHSSVRPHAAGSRPGTGGGRQGAAGRPSAAGKPGASGKPGRNGAPGASSQGNTAAEADRLASLLEPVVGAVGMDLEAVRITSAGRRRLLRLVVDADGGVGLDDIAVVSREVSVALDGSPAMGEQPYTLEVSSPGVDRPLTERRHWRRAIGRLVVAPLTAPGTGDQEPGAEDQGAESQGAESQGASGRTVEGRIIGASADGITLDVAGESRQFGYGELGPGKIKIEFARIDAVSDDDGIDDEDLDDDDMDEGADEEGSHGY
jgi:ribosome maturation factor RimP